MWGPEDNTVPGHIHALLVSWMMHAIFYSTVALNWDYPHLDLQFVTQVYFFPQTKTYTPVSANHLSSQNAIVSRWT